MDKKVLEDMGFKHIGKGWLEYQTKHAELTIAAEYRGKEVSKIVMSIDDVSYEYPLTINTKFDLEQLLKILGE